jgi:hypothetical protein
MSELRLEGRLGVETISPLRGCCVDSLLKWHPRMVGERTKCMYCENPMKAIRAGDTSDPTWTGMMNEAKFERSNDALSASSLWFSQKKFQTSSDVSRWCAERGMSGAKVESVDSAFRVVLGKSLESSDRAVWAAPGVIAVCGICKMDTGDMASGGMINPSQGAQADASDKIDIREADEGKPEVKAEEDTEKSLTPLEKALARFDADLAKALS